MSDKLKIIDKNYFGDVKKNKVDVFVAFLSEKVEEDEIKDLLPDDSFVGGHPIWYDKLHEKLQLRCTECNNFLSLILQTYAPLGHLEAKRNIIMDRILNVFFCLHCSSPKSWRIFRYQKEKEKKEKKKKIIKKEDKISTKWDSEFVTDNNDWGTNNSSNNWSTDNNDNGSWGNDNDGNWNTDNNSDWGNNENKIDNWGSNGNSNNWENNDNNDTWDNVNSNSNEWGNNDKNNDNWGNDNNCFNKQNEIKQNNNDNNNDNNNSNNNNNNNNKNIDIIVEKSPDEIKNINYMYNLLFNNQKKMDEDEDCDNVKMQLPFFDIVIESEKKYYKKNNKDKKKDKELLLKYKEKENEEENGTDEIDSIGWDGETYEKNKLKSLMRFQKRINHCPNQILRYDFNGLPLWMIEFSNNQKLSVFNDKNLYCSNCKSVRVFELQILPTLVYFINKELSSLINEYRAESEENQDKIISIQKLIKIFEFLDFSSIFVFSCSDSCSLDQSNPFIEEFIYVAENN